MATHPDSSTPSAARWTSPGLLHGADYNYEQWLDWPEVHDQDFAAMKLAGCNAMTVGIFSWSQYEPAEGRYEFEWMDRLLDRLHANGIKAILATPSGSKPAWLSKAHPETCRVDVHGHREPHALRHNHCRSSPVFRRKVAELDTRLAQRYGQHPAVILWHVSNELGSGRCCCPHCLAAFRDWLKARYGSLKALNQAWWTSFWSHTFTDWDEIFPADSSINGLMLDWARFTSDQTIDFYLEEARALRRFSPAIPITTNAMMPDVGIDYHKLARHLDVVSWDNYPRWHATGDDPAVALRTGFYHDLFRATKRRPFLLMESTPSCTNWQGVSPLKRPGVHRLASLQAVAHGSDAVLYFQWRQSRGGEEKFHGAVLNHGGGTDTRTFRDVADVGELLARLPQIAGSELKVEAAVIYDFESAWALDLAQLPRSEEKRYQEECLAHYAALRTQAVMVDVIDSSQDFSHYKILAAPMLYLIKPGVADRLMSFVASGGILVSGYLSGLVDESDLCFLGGAPGPLSDLLGLKIEETDAIPATRRQSLAMPLPSDESGPHQPSGWAASHYADAIRPAGAEIRGRYEQDFLAGSPAVTMHKVGKGQAWYLGTRLGGDFLQAFYGGLVADAQPERAWEAPLPPGVSAMRRETAGGQVTFLMNFNEHQLALACSAGPYRNLVDQSTVAATLILPPFGLALLTPL